MVSTAIKIGESGTRALGDEGRSGLGEKVAESGREKAGGRWLASQRRATRFQSVRGPNCKTEKLAAQQDRWMAGNWRFWPGERNGWKGDSSNESELRAASSAGSVEGGGGGAQAGGFGLPKLWGPQGLGTAWGKVVCAFVRDSDTARWMIPE